MTPIGAVRAIVVAAAVALPACAHAVDLSMTFAGTVSQGSSGTVSPYDENVAPGATNFDGKPVSISLTVKGAPGSLYVDSFSASWSDQTYDLPYITDWSGPGFPDEPGNENLIGFFSTVSLTNTGGSIFITPTSGFIASTDADFNLLLNFTFSTPHDPFGSFTDTGLSGGGSFDAFKTFIIDPVIGPYDADSNGRFTLTSLTQTGLPEPSTWAAMLAGFALVGAVMRARRPLTA